MASCRRVKFLFCFFFSSIRRHTRWPRDWSSDVCSSDLPSTGSSNQKGRTFKSAYYQTLGDSADITFRGDLYTSRGIGLGAEFRARTGEKSYLRLGVFSVKDRLFGTPGENQGGTALVADGVQYLPHGWLAVAKVSVVSSLAFRQVFSDDISQVINPTQESTVYANNNAGNFSFNF